MKPRAPSSAFGAGAAELHSNSRQAATLRRPDDTLDVLLRLEDLGLGGPRVLMDLALDLVHLFHEPGDLELHALQLARIPDAAGREADERHGRDDAEAAAEQDEDIDAGLHPLSLANAACRRKDAAARTCGGMKRPACTRGPPAAD